jgi:hypothetical protein
VSETEPPDSDPSQPEDPGPDGDPLAAHDEVDYFGPRDRTDGREPDEWESRWEPRAVKQIAFEAFYLALLLILAPAALIWVWQGSPREILDVDPSRYEVFRTFAYAWLAGTIGGTVFALKWLYHSVARGGWHVDRLLWRLFTPHLSGAVSTAFIAIITSQIFEILNRELLKSGPAVLGLGFLFGYFSDLTVARLYEMAKGMIGSESGRGRSDADDA